MSARAVTSAAATFTARLSGAGSAHVLERSFGDPRAMTRAIASIRKDHGLVGEAAVPDATLSETIPKLAAGSPMTPRELRDCSFGIATEVEGYGRIVDDARLMDALLTRIEGQEMHGRRVRSIVGGLASGYFAYRPSDHLTVVGPWHSVRAWLEARLARLENGGLAVELLREHRNLFTRDPCTRYADPEGSADHVDILRHDLGIAPNSWVFGEILLAQTRHACKQDDRVFRAEVDRLLAEVEEFPLFAGDVLVLLLNRYAAAPFRNEPHDALKDAAVRGWGNPLDLATHGAWGAVPRQTRRMVEGWVKRHVIELFFGVISARFGTDRRRTDFWLDYADDIDDLHIFFGDSAYRQRAPQFDELKKLMTGKYSHMTNDSENNGFLMIIKDVAFVEFSNHANACYVYDAKDIPSVLDKRLVPISLIKDQVRCLERLIHRDAWEYAFALAIKRLTRVDGRRRR